MTDKKEYARQTAHVLGWPLIIYLHFYEIINDLHILIFLVLLIFVIELIKKGFKIPLIYDFIKFAERESDFKVFPWKWFFYFTLACLLSFVLFEKTIAYASIAILCTLDSVSTLVWRKYWTHKWIINKDKSLEWSFFGFIISIIWAIIFVDNPLHALTACVFAMLIEIPEIKIVDFTINDNLTIPLMAGATLSYLS